MRAVVGEPEREVGVAVEVGSGAVGREPRTTTAGTVVTVARVSQEGFEDISLRCPDTSHGEPGGIRTHDQGIKSPLLYH